MFSSVQFLSRVWFFATPWTAACQASLSITNSRSLPKLTSIQSVMPSNHLILCHPLLLPPSIFRSIRVFSNESLLHISSVQSLSHVQHFATPWSQHARPPCSSPTPGVYSNSCALSWWCHPTVSFSVIPFSSCPQSFPASGSFQMSQLFLLGSQSIGVSASASVLFLNNTYYHEIPMCGSESESRSVMSNCLQPHEQ